MFTKNIPYFNVGARIARPSFCASVVLCYRRGGYPTDARWRAGRRADDIRPYGFSDNQTNRKTLVGADIIRPLPFFARCLSSRVSPERTGFVRLAMFASPTADDGRAMRAPTNG
jgi:hypothetical protein